MEKITFISSLLDKWTNLTDKKKLSYLTGIFFIIAGVLLYVQYIYFTNRVTELRNENIKQKNDYTIDLNRLNNLLSLEQKETKECNDNFIKYLEKNEKEIRDILFYNEKIKQKTKIRD